MSDALERVVLITPDAVAPEGHDAKMIAVAEGAIPAADANRPAWLPAKFANAEAMAASYAALEAKQSGAAPVVAPVATPAVTPTDAPLAIPADAAAVVASAGLDMSALNAEFAASGALSEASYTKLAAVGIDKAAVDVYVAGQQALVSAYESDVKSATPGGAAKYGEMVEWAKANMTAAQVEAYNTAVGGGNKDAAKLAVAGLGASFLAAVGNEPMLSGGRAGNSSADAYTSLAQMKSDMKTPLYKTDPAERLRVQSKLGRSSIM